MTGYIRTFDCVAIHYKRVRLIYASKLQSLRAYISTANNWTPCNDRGSTIEGQFDCGSMLI